jgi:hypothetical protein
MGTFLAVTLMACGGGSLTVAEYAAQTEELVAELAAEFESLDAEWESQTPGLEGARAYWERRLAARVKLLDGIRALEPPEEVTDLHATALDLFRRITRAEEDVAARVESFETAADLEQTWQTLEGQAAQTVLEEVFALCRAAQTEFDDTEDREALKDVPWIPPEMKEVIQVSFNCPP